MAEGRPGRHVDHAWRLGFDDGADHGAAGHAPRQPCSDALGVSRIHGEHHAHAHVEGPVHLACFDATGFLQPSKFGQHGQGRIDAPTEGGVQPQEVGQAATGHVAQATDA